MKIHSKGNGRDQGPPIEPLAVTISAAKTLSGLGNTTLWELIGKGTLKTVRVGRRRLIIYSSLKGLLESGSE